MYLVFFCNKAFICFPDNNCRRSAEAAPRDHSAGEYLFWAPLHLIDNISTNFLMPNLNAIVCRNLMAASQFFLWWFQDLSSCPEFRMGMWLNFQTIYWRYVWSWNEVECAGEFFAIISDSMVQSLMMEELIIKPLSRMRGHRSINFIWVNFWIIVQLVEHGILEVWCYFGGKRQAMWYDCVTDKQFRHERLKHCWKYWKYNEFPRSYYFFNIRLMHALSIEHRLLQKIRYKSAVRASGQRFHKFHGPSSHLLP